MDFQQLKKYLDVNPFYVQRITPSEQLSQSEVEQLRKYAIEKCPAVIGKMDDASPDEQLLAVRLDTSVLKKIKNHSKELVQYCLEKEDAISVVHQLGAKTYDYL